MDKIKHAVANVKDKVTGHHGHEHKHEAHENSPVKDKVSHESHPPVDAVYPDLPTHGHAHTNLDPPGAPGIIETPAPGVVGSGTSMTGIGAQMMPRI